MIRFRIIFFLFSLPIFGNGYAQTNFTLSPLAERVYEASFDLRLSESHSLLEKFKTQEPDNLLLYFLENYIDFFTLLISEDETQFIKLEKNKKARINAIVKGPKTSPYYLYSQAEIHLQWAFIRLKFDNYVTAIGELSQAYKLLKKNIKSHPNFKPNQKSLGIIYSVTGSVPSRYKGLIKFFLGLEGTLLQGDKEIFRVLAYARENSFLFEKETILMHAMIHSFLYGQSGYSWKFLNKYSLDESKSPLVGYVKSSIGHHLGRNDEAIDILDLTASNVHSKEFPYLDFLRGTYKLCRLDANANDHLISFLENFKGQSNVKSAYQKLAWYELIKGRKKGYKKYMNLARNNGISISSGDKAAYVESELEGWPNPELLKARLLFDGGYLGQALDLLEKHEKMLKTSTDTKLEYNYRLGRIYHNLGELDKAITYYSACLLIGKNSSEYYPCNAALQIGLIYEKQSKLEEAKNSFLSCLQMKPNSYRSDLHQKAKAGLSRVKK